MLLFAATGLDVTVDKDNDDDDDPPDGTLTLVTLLLIILPLFTYNPTGIICFPYLSTFRFSRRPSCCCSIFCFYNTACRLGFQF